MPLIAQRSPKIRFEFVATQKQSTFGGLPALEALARQVDLWNKLRVLPGLDPRSRTSHGYSPELIVAQLLYCYCLCSGGASLAGAVMVRHRLKGGEEQLFKAGPFRSAVGPSKTRLRELAVPKTLSPTPPTLAKDSVGGESSRFKTQSSREPPERPHQHPPRPRDRMARGLHKTA